ncbi:MAG: hypothetical protein OSA84_11190 [Akkermansiaceae bacterium]|nr:hypothetical protein [Akkermansiaceae bacterium]
MKALIKRHATPGLWLEDVPAPEPGINDVLIRVRTQISAAHTQADLTFALEQFSAVKKEIVL